MANVRYFFGSWVDAGETGLVPGAEQGWILAGFNYGDVVNITAGPLNSSEGDQSLLVKDVRTEADSSGHRRCFFTVKNVGPIRAIGYGLNISFISE